MRLKIAIATSLLLTACTPYSPHSDKMQRSSMKYQSAAMYAQGCGTTRVVMANVACSAPNRVGMPQMVGAGGMPYGAAGPYMTPGELAAMNRDISREYPHDMHATLDHNIARNGLYGASGMRPSYMGRKVPYKYGSLGAVAYDVGNDFGGLQTRLGYQTSGILGAEVEGSLGFVNNKRLRRTLAQDGNIDYGVKSSLGAFAVGRVEFSRKTDLLARVGYHTSNLKVGSYAAQPDDNAAPCDPSAGPCPVLPIITQDFFDPIETSSRSQGGIAFGAGVESKINPTDILRADITAYDMGTAYHTALSLGYLRRF
ncbi:MAG: outer membrane beta-barrel protein [Maricaulaceae bacterium]